MTNRRIYALRMDTNNTCNLKCIYCNINDYSQPAEYMSVEQFSKLASVYFPKCSYVSLSCATEPLLSPDFALFIKKLGEYKVPDTHFITNGQLLSEKIIRAAIKSIINSITLSIDGATVETYERIRGASFENLIFNLKMIDRIKNNLKSTVPIVRVQYTFFKYNAWEVIQFIEKYHSYIQEISFTQLSPYFSESYGHHLLERISYDEYSEIKNHVVELTRKYNLGYKLSFNQFNRDNLSNSGCNIPLSFRFIQSNGDVMMCDKQIYGNVFVDGEESINGRIKKAFSKYNELCKLKCTQPVAKMKEN